MTGNETTGRVESDGEREAKSAIDTVRRQAKRPRTSQSPRRFDISTSEELLPNRKEGQSRGAEHSGHAANPMKVEHVKNWIDPELVGVATSRYNAARSAPASPLSSLEKLPDELLHMVVDGLDIPDLHKASAVCKKLYVLAIPLLWRDVEIDIGREPNGPLDIENHDIENHDIEKHDIQKHDTARNVAVAQKLNRWTQSLTLVVPGESRAELLPILCWVLMKLKAASRLTSLVFRNSQLDKESWDTLDSLVNDSRANGIKTTIREVTFPTMTAQYFADLHQECLRTKANLGVGSNITVPMIDYAPCSGLLEFPVEHLGQKRTISISFQGKSYSDQKQIRKYQFDGTLAYGTLTTSVQRFCDSMGAPTELSLVKLYNPSSGRYKNRHHLFRKLGLGSFQTPIRITKLVLTNIGLKDQAGFDEFATVDLSSIRELWLSSCCYLTKLFKKFMMQQNGVNLETLVCKNTHGCRQYHLDTDPDNFVEFLQSFSGLKTLRLLTSDYWRLDWNELLVNHSTMEELVVRLGEEEIMPRQIGEIRSTCPQLKKVGFQLISASSPIREGRFTRDFKREMKRYAKELVCFEFLQELEIMSTPVLTRGPFQFDAPRDSCRLTLTAEKIRKILDTAYETAPVFHEAQISKIRLILAPAFTEETYSGPEIRNGVLPAEAEPDPNDMVEITY